MAARPRKMTRKELLKEVNRLYAREKEMLAVHADDHRYMARLNTSLNEEVQESLRLRYEMQKLARSAQ